MNNKVPLTFVWFVLQNPALKATKNYFAVQNARSHDTAQKLVSDFTGNNTDFTAGNLRTRVFCPSTNKMRTAKLLYSLPAPLTTIYPA